VSAAGYFDRRPDGRLVVRLHPAEIELLTHLADELTALLQAPPPGDPALERLFPRAYLDPTEEDAEQAFNALVAPDLLRARLDTLAALTRSLRAVGSGDADQVEVVLDEEQEAEWLGVLNDVRLTLGSRLGVTEDADDREVDPNTSEAQAFRVYDWLTYLQGDLIDALLAALPEAGTD
jgi:hypothetical protein